MSENFGKIVLVIGPTVDCEFDSDKLPNLLNALKIEDQKRSIDLTVEVALHIGDNIVRCISLGTTDGLVRGMKVIDTGGPITVPVGEMTLGRLFNLLGKPLDKIGDKSADTKR
jgi:F-type H+-transporting ATPase subunit beta